MLLSICLNTPYLIPGIRQTRVQVDSIQKLLVVVVAFELKQQCLFNPATLKIVCVSAY